MNIKTSKFKISQSNNIVSLLNRYPRKLFSLCWCFSWINWPIIISFFICMKWERDAAWDADQTRCDITRIHIGTVDCASICWFKFGSKHWKPAGWQTAGGICDVDACGWDLVADEPLWPCWPNTTGRVINDSGARRHFGSHH